MDMNQMESFTQEIRPRFVAFLATSLDGYIARPAGEIDFLDTFTAKLPSETDLGIEAYQTSIDALVLGRETFEYVVSHGSWPYSCPVIVLSRKWTKLPENALETTILCRSVEDVIAKATHHGWNKVGIDGCQVVRTFLHVGLLDEITITTVPVLLGQGRSLWGSWDSENGKRDVWLTVAKSHAVLSHPGCVQSTYTIEKGGRNNRELE